MPDITKLLAAYVRVAGEANLQASQQDPNDTRINQMVDGHIRELLRTGGPNGQILKPGNPASSLANNGCDPGWIYCGDVQGCVPEELGCS